MGADVIIDLGGGAFVKAEAMDGPGGGAGSQAVGSDEHAGQDRGDDWADGGDVSAHPSPRTTAPTQAVTLHLDAVQSVVRRMGVWAAETACGMGERTPETFEVEFGVKLGVKSGKLVGILAEVGGEASLVVRMTWSAERLTAASGDGDGAAENGPPR